MSAAVLTPEEIMRRVAELDSISDPRDPQHRDGFLLDEYGIELYWGGYPYAITWDRVRTTRDLLSWLAHVGEKCWKHATPQRMARLIYAVGERRGWNIGCW